MAARHVLGFVAVCTVALAACNALLMVDVCGKSCDTREDCGPGFTCESQRCNAPSCGGTSSGSVGGGSSGVAGSSSRVNNSSNGAASSSSGGQACNPNGGAPGCPDGERCQPNGTCTACNTADHCGQGCGNCRDLPQSVGEGRYYTCTGNTGTLSQECAVVDCSASRANCNGDDGDACEQDIVNSARNCGGCGARCASNQCSNRQCECGPESCPNNQVCQGGRCRCDGDDWRCVDGYQCSNNVCVR